MIKVSASFGIPESLMSRSARLTADEVNRDRVMSPLKLSFLRVRSKAHAKFR